MPITITTSQAPDAKPIGVTKLASNNSSTWTTLIDVPDFEIPEQTFGGSTIIVEGGAELTGPILISNLLTATVKISFRIYRSTDSINYIICNLLQVPPYDVVTFPLNGQFLKTGDRLECLCDTLNGANVTVSYTVGQTEDYDVV